MYPNTQQFERQFTAGKEMTNNFGYPEVARNFGVHRLANLLAWSVLAAAVLFDMAGLVMVVACSLGRVGDCNCGYVANTSYAWLADIATPLYIAGSLLSVCLIQGTGWQRLALQVIGCLATLAIGIATLLNSHWLALPTPIPFWGLIPVYCLVTALLQQTRESNDNGLSAFLFFLSCIVCLSLWGKHGDLDWIRLWNQNWQGLDAGASRVESSFLSWSGWGDVAVALLMGFLAVVAIPVLIAWSVFNLSPNQVGLGLPASHRKLVLIWTCIYLAVGLPLFFCSSSDPVLQSHYPYVRQFSGIVDFISFELMMLLFYFAVEFFFRGYLLFGIERLVSNAIKTSNKYLVPAIAVAGSAVPYIIWHIEKPVPELLGALVWSVVAGISAVWFRTVLHLILVHWIWNVWLDCWVLQDLGISIFG